MVKLNFHGAAFLFLFCSLWGIRKVVVAADRKTGSYWMLPLTCLLVPPGSVGTLPRILFLCCRDEDCEVEREGRGCLSSRSSSSYIKMIFHLAVLCLEGPLHHERRHGSIPLSIWLLQKVLKLVSELPQDLCIANRWERHVQSVI